MIPTATDEEIPMAPRSILSLIWLALALLAAPTAAAADRSADLFQQSYDQESAGRPADALETLERIEGEARDTYVFDLRRAWLLYRTGKHEESVKAYEAAVKRHPRAVEPRLGKMLPQMAMRRWLDAEKTAEAVLERDADNYLATSRLAFIRYSLGRYEKAAETYREVLALYPSDVEMKAGLGWSLLEQGRAADAAKRFEEILAVAPRHQGARKGLKLARTNGK
ncbi:MAG: tetratricopeptide repeat protein [Myxococcota bacterium]